jgi:hypothetical protein
MRGAADLEGADLLEVLAFEVEVETRPAREGGERVEG